MPEPIQDVLLALAFPACFGHYIPLRLLLCNEYLSFPKLLMNPLIVGDALSLLGKQGIRCCQRCLLFVL